MRKVQSLLILVALIVGIGGSVRLLTTADTRAGGSIAVPATIADLPQANGVTYEGPLPLTEQQVTIREALDAAEREFGYTDARIDPIARVVPAIVSVGIAPREQHMRVLVVTVDANIPSMGGPSTPHTMAHRLCVLVDAATGKYIMAYAAGPRDPIP